MKGGVLMLECVLASEVNGKYFFVVNLKTNFPAKQKAAGTRRSEKSRASTISTIKERGRR